MKRIISIFALVITFALQAQTTKVTSKTFDVNGFINENTTTLVSQFHLNKEQAGKLKKWNDVTAHAIQKQLVVAEMDGKTAFSQDDITAITARVKENMNYDEKLKTIFSKKQFKKYLEAQK